MQCPHPGCDSLLSDVYDSRPKGGTIFRKRRCINGHAFVTQEVVVELTEPPQKGTPLSVQIRALLLEGRPEIEIVDLLNVSGDYVRKYARELERKPK